MNKFVNLLTWNFQWFINMRILYYKHFIPNQCINNFHKLIIYHIAMSIMQVFESFSFILMRIKCDTFKIKLEDIFSWNSLLLNCENTLNKFRSMPVLSLFYFLICNWISTYGHLFLILKHFLFISSSGSLRFIWFLTINDNSSRSFYFLLYFNTEIQMLESDD